MLQSKFGYSRAFRTFSKGTAKIISKGSKVEGQRATQERALSKGSSNRVANVVAIQNDLLTQ